MSRRVKVILVCLLFVGMAVASGFVKDRPLADSPDMKEWPKGEHWFLFAQLFPGLVDNTYKLMSVNPTFIDHTRPENVSHVFMAILVFVLLICGSTVIFLRSRRMTMPLVPDEKPGVFGLFELLGEAVLSFMKGLMGEEKATRFFPLIAAFAFFILTSNLLGLIPGFLPPTAVLDTTVGLGLTVFVATHYFGIKAHGLGHFKEFLGPIVKWYALPLMLLMVLIETISHLVRPVSLSVRLMGNMMGDHKVVGIFLSFGILFIPLPMMFLGLLIAFVQTLVFCLLAMVYIALAVEDGHGEESSHVKEGSHAKAG